MQPAKPLAAELTVSALALFVGLLPCADCQGIRCQLDPHAPQAYFLRMTYVGKPTQNVFDDIGEWSAAADGKTLVLRGRCESLQSTARWRIDGAPLELFDESGALLARFESRNLQRGGAGHETD